MNKKSILTIYSVILIFAAAAYIFMFNVSIFAFSYGIFASSFMHKLLTVLLFAVLIVFAAFTAGCGKIRLQEKFLLLFAVFSVLYLVFLPQTVGTVTKIGILGLLPDFAEELIPQISMQRPVMTANIVCSAILLYISICIIPFKKSSIIFLGLSPLFIRLCASLEGFSNALCIFVICHALCMIYSRDRVQIWDILIMIVSAAALTKTGLIYMPFILLYLLVSKRKYGGAAAYFISIFIMLAVCIVIAYFTIVRLGIVFPSNPLQTAVQCAYWTAAKARTFYLTAFGGSIGVNLIFIIIYTVMAVIAALAEIRGKSFFKAGTAAVLLMLLSVFIMYIINYQNIENIICIYYIIYAVFIILAIINIRFIKLDFWTICLFALPYSVLMQLAAV